MGARVFWLGTFRVLLLILSSATLACHIAQIILLGDTSWVADKNIPYFLYFIGPGISVISSLALVALVCFNVPTIRGDRVLALLNAALMIAVVIASTLLTQYVPWTPGQTYTLSSKGFQPHCPTANPLAKNRCWLSNGMWLGSIVVAAFWLIHLLFVFVQQRSDIFDDDDYEMYDYEDHRDIAMAVTSESPVPSNKMPPMPPAHHAMSPAAAATMNNGSPYNTILPDSYGYYEPHDTVAYDQQPYDGYDYNHYPGTPTGGYYGGQQAVDPHQTYNVVDTYAAPQPPTAHAAGTMTPSSTTGSHPDDSAYFPHSPHTPIKNVPHTYDH
ncbi:hypothetical protein DM01DRAFT_1336011 [Hesseltinella vesiculosa]|uniref:Uncharacterized protein n=1 Tax=Hesseltinella vesiculosa TaxID=101127 RepID=A0A1X2GGN9_9FUNG|nr:hypothetical protein DM01DRAFT_1336011 [Hesseltinella vesiculosa]